MKKLTKNEAKVYFLGVIATIMTINSIATLSSNSDKLYLNDDTIFSQKQDFNDILSIICSYAFKSNKLFKKLDDKNCLLFSNDCNTLITCDESQVRIVSLYIDGYKERNFIDFNSFNFQAISDSFKHIVIPKVTKIEKESDILERSLSLISNALIIDDNDKERIYSITELLLNLFSKYDDISYPEMEELILLAYKVSQEQLDEVSATIIREGNYKDCAGVTVNLLNRQFSYGWINQAIRNKGLSKDFDEVTIHDLISSKGQYQVYDEKTYLYAYGDKESDAYKTVIDTLFACLMGNEKVYHFHDYVEFVAPTLTPNGGYTPEQFVKNGNKHYRHQKDSDRIPIEESILKDYFAIFKILEDEGIFEEIKNINIENKLSLN